jgi:hypothetical protein
LATACKSALTLRLPNAPCPGSSIQSPQAVRLAGRSTRAGFARASMRAVSRIQLARLRPIPSIEPRAVPTPFRLEIPPTPSPWPTRLRRSAASSTRSAPTSCSTSLPRCRPTSQSPRYPTYSTPKVSKIPDAGHLALTSGRQHGKGPLSKTGPVIGLAGPSGLPCWKPDRAATTSAGTVGG